MTKRTAPEVSPDPAAEEPAAVWLALDQLVEWKDNPRKNLEAVRVVARLIRKFGFGAPIVARKEQTNGCHEIIKGHTRFKAAKALGLARVPVRFLDLSEAEAHKLAIADNKSGEISEWDEEKLNDQMLDLSLSEATMLGFEMAELGKMMGEDGKKSKTVKLDQTFEVVIKCTDENQQLKVLAWCQENDIECRALI